MSCRFHQQLRLDHLLNYHSQEMVQINKWFVDESFDVLDLADASNEPSMILNVTVELKVNLDLLIKQMIKKRNEPSSFLIVFRFAVSVFVETVLFLFRVGAALAGDTDR